MSRLLTLFRSLYTPRMGSVDAEAWVHHPMRTGILIIPKCGGKSLKRCLDGDVTFMREVAARCRDYQFIARVRDPLERWPSGFATEIANKINHGKISESDAVSLLEDPEVVSYVINRVIFGIHTAPQAWFIRCVHSAECFELSDETFYERAASLGFVMPRTHIHKSAELGGAHGTIYRQAKALADRHADCIREAYRCDYEVLRDVLRSSS